MKHSIIIGQNKNSKQTDKHDFRILVKGILIFVFWILIWQMGYLLVGQELILPSPFSTVKAFAQMVITAGFYENVWATMYRVIAGILLSFFAGTITALLSFLFMPVRDLLKFFVVFLKSTPVMAVIIFAILWLTSGNVPIFACFLMCYPVIYTNVLTGLDNMESELIEMAKLYHLKSMTKFKYLYYPSVKPYINSSLSLASGLSWKTVVAAEVLSSPNFSMGYNLLNAKVYLETNQLFAWIIAIVGLSIIFEKIIKKLLQLLDLKGGGAI